MRSDGPYYLTMVRRWVLGSTDHSDMSPREENDVLFLKELFDIEDIVIRPVYDRHYDIIMAGNFALIADFDGETLSLAKPSNMQIKAKFQVNDKSIEKIRKSIERLWIENYVNLATEEDQSSC